MIKYFDRRLKDEWQSALVERCYQLCPRPVEIFVSYVTPATQAIKAHFLNKDLQFSAPNVIIYVQDILSIEKNFDLLNIIEDCVCKHPETNFVLITDFDNLSFQHANLQHISVPGQMLYQRDRYINVQPIQKNFTSQKTTLCLNRHHKTFRSAAVCMLYGLEINRNAYISFLETTENQNFDQEIDWFFGTDQKNIKKIWEHGFYQFKESNSSVSKNFEIYKIKHHPIGLDNFLNFDVKLRPMFENSFVEIISETLFYENTVFLTEKTYHSLLGGNIPIWNSTQGTVDFVRNLGFDVFDDIIDHSYSNEENIVDRVYKSIYNNKKILEDSNFAKQTWLSVQDRILSNFEKAKNFSTQADYDFDQAFAKIRWK
jgi:hypothetical protein